MTNMLFSRQPLTIRSMAYKSNDASSIYPMIQPAISGLHKVLFNNLNISPNLITCFSLLCIITLMNLCLWGTAGFNTIIGIPGFATLSAICIALYFVADCLDGMQGKKVGMYEHPLCEIFDHCVDVLGVVAITLSTLHLLKASNWSAALMMWSTLSMCLLSHCEHMATKTFSFPAGIGNVTHLMLGTIGLFLACQILPLANLHIPFTNFNLASILAIGAFTSSILHIGDTYRRSKDSVNLALPGMICLGIALNTWWWSQPHFLNRFTFMGTVTPFICYIWGVILGKFTDSRPNATSGIIPLAFSLMNVYLHSTVKGFFFTMGIFAFADIMFPMMVWRVSSSLKMPHWWSVQLDTEANKQARSLKKDAKRSVKLTDRNQSEDGMKKEQEEREKRMADDEKQGFQTVGKNGKPIHQKKASEQPHQEAENQETQVSQASSADVKESAPVPDQSKGHAVLNQKESQQGSNVDRQAQGQQQQVNPQGGAQLQQKQHADNSNVPSNKDVHQQPMQQIPQQGNQTSKVVEMVGTEQAPEGGDASRRAAPRAQMAGSR